MEKQTVFIKRSPSRGELPNKDGWYFTNRGLYFIYVSNLSYIKECEYFLEEVEIPSEEEITKAYLDYKVVINNPVAWARNFILNKLKGETNGI